MSEPENKIENKIGDEVGTFYNKSSFFGYTRLHCHCMDSLFKKYAVATLEIPVGVKVWVRRDEKYQTEVPSELLITNEAKIQKIEPIEYFDPKQCFCFAETGTDKVYISGKHITSDFYEYSYHKSDGIHFILNKKKAEKPG